MSEPLIKNWSFSLLKRFEKCPHEVYLDRIERQPKPAPKEDSPLIRGEVVHKAAEDYITNGGPLIKELKKIEERLNKCREAYEEGRVEVEQNWFFDKDWATTSWENRVCHIKADYIEHELSMTSAHLIDWKTGKSWGNEVSHTQQAQLYAIGTFMRYTDLLTVRATFVYTDEGKEKSHVYTRTMLSALLEGYERRAERLLKATAFPYKASRSNCKFCPYSPNNGGTGSCPYAVEV